MANVYVNTLGVPRIARNKRIYAGNSFTFTNQSQQSLGGESQRHFEIGRLTDLTLPLVIVYFTQQFTTSTPTRINLSVYRMVDIGGSRYVYQNVLYYHAALPYVNEYGFGLVIDDSEPLTGVIVEYCFTE